MNDRVIINPNFKNNGEVAMEKWRLLKLGEVDVYTSNILTEMLGIAKSRKIIDNTFGITMSEIELIEERQENSKTFKLDNNKRRLQVSIGAIHYKDDYISGERWKDIDLTWEGNRITKAPYELTHEGNKFTLKNKRTGNITTIKLDSIGGKRIPDIAWERSKGLARIPNIALDTDLEVVAEFSTVRFRRILKSDKAPLEAKFRVTGDTSLVTVRASDEDGDIPIEGSLKDGILTETLKPDRLVKYPVRIDPTWQVEASYDDVYRRLETSFWSRTVGYVSAGASSATIYKIGSGMRFTNITIPNSATIDNGTYLLLRSSAALSGGNCLTRISAEDVDDAVTFADSAATFDSRWAARTTARVDWDNIAAWSVDEEGADTTSPELKTVIQEIVNRPGWASGQDIVIFWEDYIDRSTHAAGNYRDAYSFDGLEAAAPRLIIEFTAITAPTVTTQAVSGIGAATATGNGNITDNGGEDCDKRGFVYDEASHGDPGDTAPADSDYANYVEETDTFGTGAFTLTLTGLDPETKYYVRAYAHNSAGYSYGDEVYFTTESAARYTPHCGPRKKRVDFFPTLGM